MTQTEPATHRAVGTWVHYCGSLTHLTGYQIMRITSVDGDRLTLQTATGGTLTGVRWSSVRRCDGTCGCRLSQPALDPAAGAADQDQS